MDLVLYKSLSKIFTNIPVLREGTLVVMLVEKKTYPVGCFPNEWLNNHHDRSGSVHDRNQLHGPVHAECLQSFRNQHQCSKVADLQSFQLLSSIPHRHPQT